MAASWTFDYNFKRISDAAEELKVEYQKMQMALDDRVGIVKKFMPLPLDGFTLNRHLYSGPDEAQDALMKVYEESIPIYEENKRIAADNLAILAKIFDTITRAGFPDTIQVKKPGSRSHPQKTITVSTDWAVALRAYAHVTPPALRKPGDRDYPGTPWVQIKAWRDEIRLAVEKARDEAERVAAAKAAEERRIQQAAEALLAKQREEQAQRDLAMWKERAEVTQRAVDIEGGAV